MVLVVFMGTGEVLYLWIFLTLLHQHSRDEKISGDSNYFVFDLVLSVLRQTFLYYLDCFVIHYYIVSSVLIENSLVKSTMCLYW